MAHIYNVSREVGLLDLPLTANMISSHLDQWALEGINSLVFSSSLPALEQVKDWKEQGYVCEGDSASWIAKFRLGVAGLGHKVPIAPHERRKFSPLCPVWTKTSEEHVLLDCAAVGGLRRELGVTLFSNACRLVGSEASTFALFVNGFTPKGAPIPVSDHLGRGRDLGMMVEKWLSLWVDQ